MTLDTQNNTDQTWFWRKFQYWVDVLKKPWRSNVSWYSIIFLHQKIDVFRWQQLQQNKSHSYLPPKSAAFLYHYFHNNRGNSLSSTITYSLLIAITLAVRFSHSWSTIQIIFFNYASIESASSFIIRTLQYSAYHSVTSCLQHNINIGQ